MRSPSVHCASHKCIGHCADFRALPVAMLPALVRALLRSPPALRPALPRAARSAPPATQTPRRLRSAGFPGVDLPIFHTARIDYPTGRAGLGFHTRRSTLQGVPNGPMSCLFGAIRGPTWSGDCWTERISHRYTPILIALSSHDRACPAPTYAKHAKNTGRHTTDIRGIRLRRRPRLRMSTTDIRRTLVSFTTRPWPPVHRSGPGAAGKSATRAERNGCEIRQRPKESSIGARRHRRNAIRQAGVSPKTANVLIRDHPAAIPVGHPFPDFDPASGDPNWP